jgi:hypothetical protein
VSWNAVTWADDTPVADPIERVVLMAFAGRADIDGEGVWLSIPTIARKNNCDDQTIAARVKSLRARRVIVEGDQSRAAHIPKNRRPKVYDLMIPFSEFTPRTLAEVERFRAELGRPPLSPASRPDLPVPPPSRTRRSDLGKPRPRRADEEQPMNADDLLGDPGPSDSDAPTDEPATSGNAEGYVSDTPSDPAAETGVDPAEVSTTYPQAPVVDTSGGIYEIPKSVLVTGPLNQGGNLAGNVTRATGPAADAPPPPPRADWSKPETCLCAEHLPLVMADPGADVPACMKCARVREWGQQKRAQAQEQERVAVLSEADRATSCTWHDAAGWVVDPSTGQAFEPAWRCDHGETSPEWVRARLDARPAGHQVSASAAARAAAKELARCKTPAATARPPRRKPGRRAAAAPADEAVSA